ncbi:MAG: hypothetical protein AAF587_34430 [Bacteroidota bacterium]
MKLESSSNIEEWANSFSSKDWEEFFFCLYTEDYKFFGKDFLIPRDEELSEYFLSFLVDLSPKVHTKIASAHNTLLKESLRSDCKYTLAQVLLTITHLNLPVDLGLIQYIIIDQVIPQSSISLILSAFLSNLNNRHASFIDWLTKQDKSDFLVPHFISYHSSIDPIRALSFLKRIKTKPKNEVLFLYPIRNSLLALQTRPETLRDFASQILTYPKWAIRFIRSIIEESKEFENIKRTIDGNYSAKKNNTFGRELDRVVLYRSVFPDMVLVDVIKDLGVFNEQGIDLEIRFAPWNKILDEIKNVITPPNTFVIANERVWKRKSIEIFKGRRLTRFEGFEIIGNKSANVLNQDIKLVPFEEILSLEMDSGRDWTPDQYHGFALKQLLKSVSKKKIIASRYTDYFITLLKLLKDFDIDSSQLEIISNLDPYDGYLKFIEGKADIFIGSSNLHLLALKDDRFLSLISEKNHEFGAQQYNSLIARVVDGKESELEQHKRFQNLIAAYNFGLEEVLLDKDKYLPKIHSKFQELIRHHYKEDYKKFELQKDEIGHIVFDGVFEYIDFYDEEGESITANRKTKSYRELVQAAREIDE